MAGRHCGQLQWHRSHPYHHQRHLNLKGPELSSDWPSLYLASKLAYWSGLCYFPYETLSRTLQEEGLQLVAYGRTSYTCWYVADGCVDFDALTRRAFPKRHSQRPPATPVSADASAVGAPPDVAAASGGPHASTHVGSVPTAPSAYERPQEDATRSPNPPGAGQAGDGRTAGGSSSLSAEGTRHTDNPYGGHKADAMGSAVYSNGSGADGGSRNPSASGRSEDAHATPHPNGHSHNQTAGANGHGHRHVLRDGHIHMHLDPPQLHLRTPHRTHQHPADSSGIGVSGDGGGRPGQGGGAGGTRYRFVFLRGVQWGAHDSNTLSLSASLASFWPSPLLPPEAAAAKPPELTPRTDTAVVSANGAGGGGAGSNGASGGGAGSRGTASGSAGSSGGSGEGGMPSLGELVAHSGVASMARELLPVLLPHIRGASAAGAEHLVFAGHSLGGSLAKLIWSLAILQGHSSPASSSCHTFGSPPVLAHASGGGGARVLRVLRAPPGSAVNWVLEHDPIPRAMLTADPYLTAARSALPGLSTLLSLRGALLGEGAALSSGRFLYETVGELMLLRWASRGGCEVVPVSEADAESLLRMALDEAVNAPVRTLQYWLDHHHASYHHDLEAAALAACRRQARSRQAAQVAG